MHRLAGSPRREGQRGRRGVRQQAVAAQSLARGIHEHGAGDGRRALHDGGRRVNALVAQGLAVFGIHDRIPDVHDAVARAGGRIRQAARIHDLVITGGLMLVGEGQHVGGGLDFLVGQQSRP